MPLSFLVLEKPLFVYWSGISRTFFEPRRHEDTEKNKGKTPCLCVSVVKGFVRPLSDDYK